MASLQLIQTYEYKLENVEIIDGQLIVCLDTGSLYRDSSGKRIKLGSDIEVVESLPDDPQENKFYYINETNELWIYDGSWNEINSSLIAHSDIGGGVSVTIGDKSSESGIKFKGSGATSVTTDGDGTISIETDPNGSINVISNLEIDKLLSM